MPAKYPAVHYSCPCTDITTPNIFGQSNTNGEEEEQNFDPYSPRANYNLYPLEHLLFCNECHEIRCPKCCYEEVMYYYCPGCLLETPSSVVKGESNKCTRSCFQCPVCVSPMSIQAYGISDRTREKNDEPAYRDGPFILACPFCSWTTLEIDMKFDKSINISGQLAKLYNGHSIDSLTREDVAPSIDQRIENGEGDGGEADVSMRDKDRFVDLANFYKNQLAEINPSGALGLTHGYGLDSPSQLSRLLASYGVGGLKKQRGKTPIMREAKVSDEGLAVEPDDESDIIQRMQELGWDGLTDPEQRSRQPHNPRFLSDVRPIPMQLRSKRLKRCRTCRHQLVRPDEKRHSIRYKIRLVALSFVPRMSIQSFQSGADLTAIALNRPSQFLVTLKNPLYDQVKVTLSTPRSIEGDSASRVTILCPQFEIGATKDVFDEALEEGNKDRRLTRDMTPAEGQQPEAGKIWERGLNWTTTVLEVVPGNGSARCPLKIAVYVRMEFDTDENAADPYTDNSAVAKTTKDKKVRKEVAYWTALTLGFTAGA